MLIDINTTVFTQNGAYKLVGNKIFRRKIRIPKNRKPKLYRYKKHMNLVCMGISITILFG